MICFRRKTDAVMQILTVLWVYRRHPRFIIQFAEAPLAGINYHGDHVSAEDVLPGNVELLRGSLRPGDGAISFRTHRPIWQRIFSSRQNENPDQLVDSLLSLLPEVFAWWETKTRGPHLRLLPVVHLPGKPKFPEADQCRKSPVRASRIHYIVAHSLKLTGWCSIAAFLALFWAPSAPALLTAPSAMDIFVFVLATLAAVPLGMIFGGVLLCPFVHVIGSKINGAPFREGDRVRILVGPHRDRIASVYAVWKERNQVRVALDEQAYKDVKDVFGLTQVCREKIAKPAAESDSSSPLPTS